MREQMREPARELASWKKKVRKSWPGIRIERIDVPVIRLYRDQILEIKVAVELAGLSPDDVLIDLLLGGDCKGKFDRGSCSTFAYVEQMPDERALFTLSLPMTESGMQAYKIRIYPYHSLLSQRFEVGCMVWL